MLAHRLRCYPAIEPTLGECLVLAGEELIATSRPDFPPYNEYSSSLCPSTPSLTPNMAIRHHVITMCVQHKKGTVYKNLLRRCETT